MGTARITFLLALGASLWGATAALDVEAPKPEAEASATVTVTAEAIPVEIARTPNTVMVIDEATLKTAGSSNLADLLVNQIPGTVSAFGGVGTTATIALGSGRPQDTVITLDGLRMNDVTSYSGAYANLMSMSGIARVEIQQGPASTRFGSDAMGGAVAMYSSGSPSAGFSGEALGAVGNEGIVRGGLQGAYGWDKGWVRFALSAQREDQVLDPPNQYRTTGTFLGLGRQAGDDTLVTMNYYNNYAAIPTPISFGGVGSIYNTWVPQQETYNRTQILDAKVRTQFSPTLSGELTLGQVLQDSLLPGMGFNIVSYTPYESRQNQVVGHVTWQPSDKASLVVGVDGSEAYAMVPNQATYVGNAYGDATHMAVLAEGQGEIVPNLRLVGSMRTERDHDDLPNAANGRSATGVTETTAKVGVNWTLPAGFRAYANAGTGFNSAPLFDSIYNFLNAGQALNNEKSHAGQAGLTFGSGPWQAGLVLSRTLFSSVIYFNSSMTSPTNFYGLYANGNEIRIQTAELKGGYETTRWGVTGFYRNQETRDLEASPGNQLISPAAGTAPFQTLGLRGFRVMGDIRVDVRWSWIGPRYQYGSPTLYPFDEHYNDLGFSAAWSVRKDLTLTLRGDNLMQPKTSQAQWISGTRLFQNDASATLGYPAQPPTVNLEVRYRF
jgi:outer membrane cobalamin receptor